MADRFFDTLWAERARSVGLKIRSVTKLLAFSTQTPPGHPKRILGGAYETRRNNWPVARAKRPGL